MSKYWLGALILLICLSTNVSSQEQDFDISDHAG